MIHRSVQDNNNAQLIRDKFYTLHNPPRRKSSSNIYNAQPRTITGHRPTARLTPACAIKRYQTTHRAKPPYRH
jgi:hypothetical protein